LRALWALHAIGGVTEKDLLKLTAHESPHLRSWAIQLALEDGQVSDEFRGAMEGLAKNDPSPVVRLYLASAVPRMAPEKRWEIVRALHTHGEDAGDHNLPLMGWYALESLAAVDFNRALAIGVESKLPKILEFSARRVAALGTPEALGALTAALEKLENEERQAQMLAGLEVALKGQRTAPLPAGWERVEERLAKAASGDVRARVQSLSLTFGSPRALGAARQTVQDTKAPSDLRRRSLDALLNVKDAALPPILIRLLAEPELRAAALRGLAAYAEPETPKAILAVYGSLAPEEKRDALLTLASRAAFAQPLVTAMVQDQVPARDISADIARQLRGLNQPEINAQLEKVWGVSRETSADKKAAQAKFKALIEDTKLARPNPAHGRQLFAQTCAACHTLFGEGGKIGPDITGSNRADLDYLLHNILDPNAEIPNAYRMAMVETKDGRVLAGVANQQDPKVVVVTTPNETLTLPRTEIKSLTMAEMSMMPEGLLAPWTDSEVRDLIAYLRSPAQVPLPGQ
jgi:putative heme-binding domain-containing protein